MGLVEEVHIDLGGGVGAAVAQGFADAEEGHVAAVRDTGEAVAQAVEGHIGQSRALEDPLEAVAQIVGLVGLPAVVADDEAAVPVGVPQAGHVRLPLPPEALQRLVQILQPR